MVRQLTRSLLIGTAKVMSYENLDKAGVARAAKDKAAADKAKGRRGRKRKASWRDADGVVEGEGDGERQELGSTVPIVKNKRAKRTRVQGPDPKPWRVPVAPMYAGAI